MREYSFRPAAVRKIQVWTIKDGHLMRRGGERTVDLSQVSGAVWNEVAYRGTRSAWLHLDDPGGETQLHYNYGGEGQQDFLDLLQAVTTEFDRNPSELRIKVGYGAAATWALFLIGIVGALFGLFMLFAGASGMVRQNALFAIVFGVGFLGFAGMLAWRNQPWASGMDLTPREFSVVLQALGAAPMEEPEDNSGKA